jgi:hypothetical protein
MSPRLSTTQSCEHFGGVAFHLYLGEDLLDLAVPVDHKGGALNARELLAIQILFFPDAVVLGHLVVNVAQQSKWQVVFLLEARLNAGSVRADADDRRLLVLKL